MSTQLQGHWDQIVGKLRQRWGQLGDDELMEFEGNVQELVGFIELRTSDARDDILEYVNAVIAESEGVFDRVQRVAGDYAGATGDAVSRAYEQVSQGVRNGYQEATERVRKRPVGSVAVAFGSGLVAGVLVALALRNR